MTNERDAGSPGAINGERWFAAFTQARRESPALENLQRRGWPTFLSFQVAT